MGKTTKIIIRRLLARPSVEIASFWPSLLCVTAMKRLNRIQIAPQHLRTIATTIKNKAPCRLLVFGLGNDSLFWHRVNRGGTTIFIEDSVDWIRRVTERRRELTACLVRYDTRIADWKLLLEQPALLGMRLDDHVTEEMWDIILVDAPSGYNDQTPGRMASIYQSSRLIRRPGDVFVHDCHREVEDAYATRFLGKENMKQEIAGSGSLLRHYYLANCRP